MSSIPDNHLVNVLDQLGKKRHLIFPSLLQFTAPSVVGELTGGVRVSLCREDGVHEIESPGPLYSEINKKAKQANLILMGEGYVDPAMPGSELSKCLELVSSSDCYSAPFPCIFVEMAPGLHSHLVTIEDSFAGERRMVKICALLYWEHEDTGEYTVYALGSSEKKEDFLKNLEWEKANAPTEILEPSEFYAEIFVINTKDKSKIKKGDRRGSLYVNLFSWACYTLDMLTNRKSHMGEVSLNLKTKLKTSEGSEVHRIRKVVYVKPKKFKSSVKRTEIEDEVMGHSVVWKHSWEVMGHWRGIQGLGKNRQGEYVVANKTWVLPHVKGEGPLVKKTRLVEK